MHAELNNAQTSTDVEALKSTRWKLAAGAGALAVGFVVSFLEASNVNLHLGFADSNTEAFVSFGLATAAAFITIEFFNVHDKVRAHNSET